MQSNTSIMSNARLNIDYNSVGIYGFNSLGMSLYSFLDADEFIGWKNSRSARNIIEKEIIITFNNKNYSHLKGHLKNGLSDAFERNDCLPGLILLTTRIDGIYSFFDELIKLLYAAQTDGWSVEESVLPICVICSNGVEISDFNRKLYRLVESSGLLHKQQIYELLQSVIVFSATYQTSSQEDYKSECYHFCSTKRGMLVLGSCNERSCRYAHTILTSRGYPVQIGLGFNSYIHKNLVSLLHGFLSVKYLSHLKNPFNGQMILADIVEPLKSPDKFINAGLMSAQLSKDKIKLTNAYYQVMSKAGFEVPSESVEDIYKAIDKRVGELGIDNHVSSYVRFFKFAVQNDYPIADELNFLSRLALMASRQGLYDEEQVFFALKECLINLYYKFRIAWLDIKSCTYRIVTLDGQIVFRELEQLFKRAAANIDSKAVIVFLGSSHYLSAGTDCTQIDDIDYVVYGTAYQEEPAKSIWLNDFYREVNRLLASAGCVFHASGDSMFGTSYSAVLELPFAAKKQYMLHTPSFFTTRADFLKHFYPDSIVIWRWFTDKSNAEHLDKDFCAQFPVKAVKRFLCLGMRISSTEQQYSIYLKVLQMFREDIECCKILKYIENTGVLIGFAEYMVKLEQSLNFPVDSREIFKSTEPGNAAKRFVQKFTQAINPELIQKEFRLVLREAEHIGGGTADEKFADYFLNAQKVRDDLRASNITACLPSIPKEAGVVIINPTDYCSLGCRLCAWKIRQKPKTGFDPQKVLSKDKVNNAICFLREAKTSFLVISGGGEPLDEWESVLHILREIAGQSSVKQVEIQTSGLHFKTPEETQRCLTGLSQAIDQKDDRQIRINLRISLDDAHADNMGIENYLHLMKEVTNYEKFIYLTFAGYSGDYAIHKLAALTHSKIEPYEPPIPTVTYDFIKFVLPDGTYFPMHLKRTAAYLGRAIGGLRITPEFRQKSLSEHLKMVYFTRGSNGSEWLAPNTQFFPFMGDNKEIRGSLVVIKPDGSVSINGAFQNDTNADVGQSVNEIFECFSKDIGQIAFREKGYFYIKSLLSEIEPGLIRNIELSRLFSFNGAAYASAQIRLYLMTRMIQDYVSEGRIRMEDIPEQYIDFVKLPRDVLAGSYLHAKRILGKDYYNIYEIPSQRIFKPGIIGLLNGHNPTDLHIEIVRSLFCKNVGLWSFSSIVDNAVFPEILVLLPQDIKQFVNCLIIVLERCEKTGKSPVSDDMPIIFVYGERGDLCKLREMLHKALPDSGLEDGEHWFQVIRPTLVCTKLKKLQVLELQGENNIALQRAKAIMKHYSTSLTITLSKFSNVFPYDENSLSTINPVSWHYSVRGYLGIEPVAPYFSISYLAFMTNEIKEALQCIQDDFFRDMPFLTDKFFRLPATSFHLTIKAGRNPQQTPYTESEIEETREAVSAYSCQTGTCEIVLQGIQNELNYGRIQVCVVLPNGKQRAITILKPYRSLPADQKEVLIQWINARKNIYIGTADISNTHFIYTEDNCVIKRVIDIPMPLSGQKMWEGNQCALIQTTVKMEI